MTKYYVNNNSKIFDIKYIPRIILIHISLYKKSGIEYTDVLKNKITITY